jgi:hypothetical protein
MNYKTQPGVIAHATLSESVAPVEALGAEATEASKLHGGVDLPRAPPSTLGAEGEPMRMHRSTILNTARCSYELNKNGSLDLRVVLLFECFFDGAGGALGEHSLRSTHHTQLHNG